MQALVKVAKGDGFLELREVPEPVLDQDDWVIIEVKGAGICGTDVHIRHDQFPYYPPVTLGHEFAGDIVAVGSAVAGWAVGDRIVAEPHSLACGNCRLCRTGNIQLCPAKRSPGWGIDGAFAKYIKMPAQLLHRLPEGVSYVAGAVMEPAAIVAHEVCERGSIEVGDTVAIFGCGPIGLLAGIFSRLAGAARVIVVGTDRDVEVRFPKARAIPVDTILNIQREDVVAKIDRITGGRGADLVVEASGAPAAITLTAAVVRMKGRIAAIGIPPANVGPFERQASLSDQTVVPSATWPEGAIPFDWRGALFKVCDIRFNFSSSFTGWEKVLALASSGRLDPSFIVTHQLPLAQWEKAFNLLETGEAIKVVLIP